MDLDDKHQPPKYMFLHSLLHPAKPRASMSVTFRRSEWWREKYEGVTNIYRDRGLGLGLEGWDSFLDIKKS